MMMQQTTTKAHLSQNGWPYWSWGRLQGGCKLINKDDDATKQQPRPTFHKTNGHIDHVGDCTGDVKSAQGQDSSPRPQIMQHSHWQLGHNKWWFWMFHWCCGHRFLASSWEFACYTKWQHHKMAIPSLRWQMFIVMPWPAMRFLGDVSFLKVIQGLTTPGFLVERDQRCWTRLILGQGHCWLNVGILTTYECSFQCANIF